MGNNNLGGGGGGRNIFGSVGLIFKALRGRSGAGFPRINSCSQRKLDHARSFLRIMCPMS